MNIPVRRGEPLGSDLVDEARCCRFISITYANSAFGANAASW
jgi:hypothetical protein